MKLNAEVGRGDCRGSISYSHQNSELLEKENFTIHNSPFRIPKSSLTHYSIIPMFPPGRRPIVSEANKLSDTGIGGMVSTD